MPTALSCSGSRSPAPSPTPRWSSCGEEPRPGEVCTFTYVSAFLAATRERASGEYDLHSRRSPVVRLYQSTCEVVLDEGELLCVPLEERLGRTTGPLNRLDERESDVDRDIMFRAGTRDWQRDCTAVGTVDGVTPPGELVSCQLYRVHQTEMRVLHGR